MMESNNIEAIRRIMKANFFGPKEWFNFYGLVLPNNPSFPWTEETLMSPCPFNKDKKIKETHFAFLGVELIGEKPLTIIRWQKIHPPTADPRFFSYEETSWYFKEPFASQTTCRFRWYLMPLISAFPSSISDGYEIPLAIEEITKIILCRKKNIPYSNSESFTRCWDRTLTIEKGSPVDISFSPGKGIIISFRMSESNFAASRKIPEA